MDTIDFNKLDVILFSGEYLDLLGSCNFKENDGSDPLGVDEFIHQKAIAYKENNLSVIYTVKYYNEIVGFFTVSMGALEVKKMRVPDKIEDASQLVSYPALLLGNMGVEKKFRDKGIGKWICKFCIGLAIDLSSKIGCGYVYLESNNEKRTFYEKLDFVTSGKANTKGKIWMYRKIFAKSVLRETSEHLSLNESVAIKKISGNQEHIKK